MVDHSTHQNYNLGGTRLKSLQAVKLIWWDFGQAKKATYISQLYKVNKYILFQSCQYSFQFWGLHILKLVGVIKIGMKLQEGY